MKRIYADFNDIATDGALPLTCRGSLASIARLQEPLQEGETVLLSDGELEAIARVYRRNDGAWEARAGWLFAPVASPRPEK